MKGGARGKSAREARAWLRRLPSAFPAGSRERAVAEKVGGVLSPPGGDRRRASLALCELLEVVGQVKTRRESGYLMLWAAALAALHACSDTAQIGAFIRGVRRELDAKPPRKGRRRPATK